MAITSGIVLSWSFSWFNQMFLISFKLMIFFFMFFHFLFFLNQNPNPLYHLNKIINLIKTWTLTKQIKIQNSISNKNKNQTKSILNHDRNEGVDEILPNATIKSNKTAIRNFWWRRNGPSCHIIASTTRHYVGTNGRRG